MPEISIKAEPVFHIGHFVVTNSVLLAVVAVLVMCLLAFLVRRQVALIPSGIQNFFELIMEAMLDFMDPLTGSREKSEKYFPLVMTIFLFILLSNWLGLLPGIGSLLIKEGEHYVPLFRAPAADLNFTVALAIISLVFINFAGIVALGARRHFGKFFNFQNPIMSFVGLLELISEFVKIVSFSFRLFGNVFAGEVLLIILGFLVPYVLPLPFLLMEYFVGLIQALIFATLTLVFVAIAITGHEEGHH